MSSSGEKRCEIAKPIRTWEVLDQDVSIFCTWVRREEFVPAEHRAFAFSDLEIPLYEGADEDERMMQPKLRSAHPSGIGAEENRTGHSKWGPAAAISQRFSPLELIVCARWRSIQG